MAETADDGVYIREATREQVKTRKKAIKDRLKKSEGVSWADFEILTLLGHGAFGKVWKVKKKDDGCIYAMKTMRKGEIVDQDLVNHTILERDIMGMLGSHPFIVDLHYAFQTEEKLHLVMDLLPGGSLFDRLSTSPEPFSEEGARCYAAECLLAIEAMHECDIVYRDLKLENMLLDAEGHVRATDFGLAAKVKKGQRVKSFSGTAMYLAPEMLSKKGHSKSVDVWAYGVLLHIMLTQEPPFWSDNRNEMFEMIREHDPPLDSEYLTPDAKSLLRGLLQKDIRVRLGCGEKGWDEVKQHPWFKGINWDDVLAKKLVPPIRPNKEEDFSEGEAFRESIRAEDKVSARGVDSSQLFKDFDFVSIMHRKLQQNRKDTTMTNVKVAIIFMRVIKLSTKMNGKVLALKYKYQDKVDKVEESGETIKSIASAEEVQFAVDNAISISFGYANASPPPKDARQLVLILQKLSTKKDTTVRDPIGKTTLNLIDYCSSAGEHTQAFDIMKSNRRIAICVAHFKVELDEVPLGQPRKASVNKVDASDTKSSAQKLFAAAPPTSPRANTGHRDSPRTGISSSPLVQNDSPRVLDHSPRLPPPVFLSGFAQNSSHLHDASPASATDTASSSSSPVTPFRRTEGYEVSPVSFNMPSPTEAGRSASDRLPAHRMLTVGTTKATPREPGRLNRPGDNRRCISVGPPPDGSPLKSPSRPPRGPQPPLPPPRSSPVPPARRPPATPPPPTPPIAGGKAEEESPRPRAGTADSPEVPQLRAGSGSKSMRVKKRMGALSRSHKRKSVSDIAKLFTESKEKE